MRDKLYAGVGVLLCLGGCDPVLWSVPQPDWQHLSDAQRQTLFDYYYGPPTAPGYWEWYTSPQYGSPYYYPPRYTYPYPLYTPPAYPSYDWDWHDDWRLRDAERRADEAERRAREAEQRARERDRPYPPPHTSPPPADNCGGEPCRHFKPRI